MPRQNNVIIITPAYPLRGGIASSSERLALELQACGYRVTIYTFRLQYPDFLFPGKTQYSKDPPPSDLNIKVRINSINPINWLSVGNEIKKIRPDIVITRFWLPFMGPCLGTIHRIIKRNGHTRIVGLVDNIIPHEKRPGDHLFARYFVSATDAFIVMSKAVGKEMRLFTKAKPIKYIPHPIYDNYGELVDKMAARRFLNLPEKGKYLLFFGFIRAYKGLDLLIKAMNDDRIRTSNIKLIVAGEYYSNQDEYEQLIQSESVENSLILHTDFIPNEKVRYYMCAADLVVQPYKTATQSGISQLAYYFNKPMIATRVGGLPEIVDHEKGGYIVDIDPRAIADAILNFYSENKESDFVAHVKVQKHRYSWGAMVDGIEELRKSE